MHLTRMYLNPARRGARMLLASPQRMHAAVLSGFPPHTQAVEDTGRVLWRLDRGASNRTELFISSPDEPDLTHLVEQAGWPTREAWQTRPYAPLLERLATGQQWAFRLTANPVRHVRSGDEGRSKPVAHVTAGQQLQWLLERAPKWGIDVVGTDGPTVSVVRRDTASFERRSQGRRHRVTVATATYEGVLRVESPDELRTAMTLGVGRARGYGCGLITLAPVR